MLAMPFAEVITQRMYDEILAFTQRGGIVIADQYLGPEIPGAIKLSFDFTHRDKINADAIASGVMYVQWDDHLNPKTAELAQAKGVTAEDDQKIMESYARQLSHALTGKVTADVSVNTPRALVNVLEKNGTTYLVLVNDNRAYDERTGPYHATMEKLMPQTVTVTLRNWQGSLQPYDMLEKKPLAVTRNGNCLTFQVALDELGGKLVAIYPAALAKVTLSAPADMRRGSHYSLSVALHDDAGREPSGLQPLRLSFTDPKGEVAEYTGYYCAENGRLSVPFFPAMNDAVGNWNAIVEDLTAGRTTELTFQVR